MREISKEEGRALNAKYPQYVYATCHQRHYWVEESKEGLAALAEIKKDLRRKMDEKLADKKDRGSAQAAWRA